MAETNYEPEYDTRSESVRADALPASFGRDDPEVIRLAKIRDDIEAESKAINKRFGEFDEWRCGIVEQIERMHCEIVEIDRRRPQLLADLLIAGGDFGADDELMQRKADLQKQLERFKLAQPLLGNQRSNLEQLRQDGHQSFYTACQAVDAKLAELRMAHIVSLRR